MPAMRPQRPGPRQKCLNPVQERSDTRRTYAMGRRRCAETVLLFGPMRPFLAWG